MLPIEKYTIGMGDRFAHQGNAQLAGVITANNEGIPVHPVWNKSNREHKIVKSQPKDLRHEADEAVRSAGWTKPYYVDADHINLDTVEPFLQCSNFFTLDVADQVGQPAPADDVKRFSSFIARLGPTVCIPGIDQPVTLDASTIKSACDKFLSAILQAGRIYRHIASQKDHDSFVTEVSIDETDQPQNPVEMLLILAMLAMEEVPVQTIAPKFTGRFNKGVDYVGDLSVFAIEFEQDILVINYAVREFGLPVSLKLSVHSGSDKFSIYPIINRLVKQHGAGLHLKTAGTTWLEEVIGLAEAGNDALHLAKDIYSKAHGRFDELTSPYATVIDIDRARLPDPAAVASWNSNQFTSALRHDPSNPGYNPHFRQLIHVAFKVAAEMGDRYTAALQEHREIIARNVTTNLWQRHIQPVFC